MAIGDISLLGMLKTKMRWHEARQRVLADNVANADTPRYRPKELKPLDFSQMVTAPAPEGVSPARTNPRHLPGEPMEGGGPFDKRRGADWEITPAGNAVVLEEQMIKVAENQFDFQLASTLYKRSLGLLRTAIGRKG